MKKKLIDFVFKSCFLFTFLFYYKADSIFFFEEHKLPDDIINYLKQKNTEENSL